MYRALYRKWRPQRFEDVVGQQAIVTALKNQVAAGRVGHAYLFTGVRGTGKTTCAKIFAKAVNCLDPQNGDPCGVCAACRGIDNGSILDVVEMDAASNNSVEDIRDIRDETAYTPSMCKYKVYIIDEVHMLSGSAFNALLKTLEEPPAHVIFILATTEIQKVPATILSRCQRYDFTRITPADIAGRVETIAKAEQLALTPGAAALIARLADGALRDALSILDTCAGVTTSIDEDVVRRMAGVTDKSYLFEISDAIAAQNGVAALAKLSQLRQQSVDVKRLAEELIGHYRSLMLAALPGGKALLSGVSPDEEQLYLQKASQIGQPEAIRAIRALGGALEKMTRGNDQRIELELAIFSLTDPALQPAAPAVPAAAAQPAVAAPAVPRPFASAPVQPFAAAPAPAAVQPPVPAAEPAPTPAELPLQPEPVPQPEPPPPPEELLPPPDDGEAPPWENQPIQPREVAQRPAKPARSAQPEPKPDAAPGVVQPYPVWDEVVRRISEMDPMLYSYLKRSKGYCDGKRVLIDGGQMFNDFLRANKDSQALIKKVLAQISGKNWPIGPYDARKANSARPAAGNAEQSLEALRARGLEVVIQDNEKQKRKS
ncbi:MAG: DNA polymerase III subunit gamma/tau [Faecalibacterium sp.]|nr:DNA polymerase III subunit gamma/tau [Faecalibacterium sp.]